jgi:hypothetical protein
MAKEINTPKEGKTPLGRRPRKQGTTKEGSRPIGKTKEGDKPLGMTK